MLSGYSVRIVAVRAEDDYLCLPCARERFGEMDISRVCAGLDTARAGMRLEPVSQWMVDDSLADLAEDPDATWGTSCDQCGADLGDSKHAPVTRPANPAFCVFCWSRPGRADPRRS